MAHENAIRKLTYLRDYGGYLVSASYERHAKVWQPANIYGEALFGRLKGHNRPIVSVDSLPGQPFVVTVDQDNIVIIWDIRNLKMVQMITL